MKKKRGKSDSEAMVNMMEILVRILVKQRKTIEVLNRYMIALKSHVLEIDQEFVKHMEREHNMVRKSEGEHNADMTFERMMRKMMGDGYE